MTDTNISYDLASMNKQERGRHSNPHYGLIPNGKSGLRMLYLGGFFFLAGYLGTGVAAITTFTLRHSTRWVALYLAAEFAVVFFILVKTGRLYFILASGHAASVFIWFIFYLMMTFVPFTQLRAPAQFGGALFARWVTWRLVANTVAFALLAKDTAMWRCYGALLGSAVVGIGVVMYNASDTHRWTLYQNRLNAKEFELQTFNSEIEPASRETTVDGCRVAWIAFIHPSYIEPQVLLDWLRTLELDNPIFAEETKFGKSAGKESGKTHESWFNKVLEKIKFYNKSHGESVVKATEHLEVLRAELIQRNESRQIQRDESRQLVRQETGR